MSTESIPANQIAVSRAPAARGQRAPRAGVPVRRILGCAVQSNEDVDSIVTVAQLAQPGGYYDEDVLTITEVAADLRCSKAHVYNLINGAVPGAPRLPAMAMGRRKVVRRGSLRQWKRGLEQDGHGSAMLPPSPEVDAVDACERK